MVYWIKLSVQLSWSFTTLRKDDFRNSSHVRLIHSPKEQQPMCLIPLFYYKIRRGEWSSAIRYQGVRVTKNIKNRNHIFNRLSWTCSFYWEKPSKPCEWIYQYQICKMCLRPLVDSINEPKWSMCTVYIGSLRVSFNCNSPSFVLTEVLTTKHIKQLSTYDCACSCIDGK